MSPLHIEPTASSPGIVFDPAQARLEIKGESYPENCNVFYENVFSKLRRFLDMPQTSRLQLNMEIVYFNSSSSKTFMDLFDMLDEAARQGKEIEVNWCYHPENETAMECGEEFQEDVSALRFNLREVAGTPDCA